MGSSLYFLKDGKAVEMSEQPYGQEKVLQDLIAQNPNILLRSSDPDGAKLFLVSREFIIAESGDSTNSYAIDHLMVDESGIPVLVEVKRCVDTRSRREVVAQMLDYASRASAWDVDMLRDSFFKRNPDMVGTEYAADAFWDQVENNLKAERLRLIFAADQIPDTLRTLIEFLNRNLTDIDVYGVEIRQYQTQDATLLTSVVIGGGTSDSRRASLRSVEWDADAFSEYLLKHNRKDAVDVAKQLLEFSLGAGLSYSPGRGTKYPSFLIRHGRIRIFTASSWVKGGQYICSLEFCIRDLVEHLPTWTEDHLRKTLSSIPGENAARTEGKLWDTPHYLYLEMQVLSSPENMASLKGAITKLCSAISEKQGIVSVT